MLLGASRQVPCVLSSSFRSSMYARGEVIPTDPCVRNYPATLMWKWDTLVTLSLGTPIAGDAHLRQTYAT